MGGLLASGLLGPPDGAPAHHVQLRLGRAQLVGDLQFVADGQIDEEQADRILVQVAVGELLDNVGRRSHEYLDRPLPQPLADGLDLPRQPVGLDLGGRCLCLGRDDGLLGGVYAGQLQSDVPVELLERGDQGLIVGDERVHLLGDLGSAVSQFLTLGAQVCDLALFSLRQRRGRHQRSDGAYSRQRADDPAKSVHPTKS